MTEHRPRADKRAAILSGALTVFARDGYSRAGIDTIAAQAGVSSRTIYNHFEDKAALFQAVIQASSQRIADVQIALIDRHFFKITDLAADLTEFALVWVGTGQAEFAEHFALVRQINADAEHIPAAAIEAWQRTGPLRVRAELARRMGELAAAGLLAPGDPDRMALHFMVLVSTDNPSFRAVTRTEAERAGIARAGVHTFLHGHLPAKMDT